MPLSDIDWTKDARDFLRAWCQTVAEALGGAADCRSRQDVAALVTGSAAPAAPTLVAPARLTDRFGVNVTDGGQLTAAVLFVTPDNKSDSDASLAFAVRVAALLTAGVGIVVVDALPGPLSWATHLHSLVGVYPLPRRPRNGEAPVLVVQPYVDGGAGQYAVWHHAVAAGFPLPAVPAPVRGATHATLDLEATYLEACRRSRPAE